MHSILNKAISVCKRVHSLKQNNVHILQITYIGAQYHRFYLIIYG
jgi:hypothetical protein